MLSEKFPEKVKVRKIVSQRRAGSVGGKFPKRNGQPNIISKGLKKKGFGESVPLRPHLGR
jgi:hypothetical protein